MTIILRAAHQLLQPAGQEFGYASARTERCDRSTSFIPRLRSCLRSSVATDQMMESQPRTAFIAADVPGRLQSSQLLVDLRSSTLTLHSVSDRLSLHVLR